eukprot:1205218-Pleurochrysis_carterae.AAC.1
MPRTWPVPPSSPPNFMRATAACRLLNLALLTLMTRRFRRSSLKCARLWIQVDLGAAVSKPLDCGFRYIQAQQSQKCPTLASGGFRRSSLKSARLWIQADSGAAVSKVLDSGF